MNAVHCDISTSPSTGHQDVVPPPRGDVDVAYRSNAHLLGMALDQIDYGMVLLSFDGKVCYMNHAATSTLAGTGDGAAPVLRIDVRLRTAITACSRGLRSMVTLAMGESSIAAAVIPLATEPSGVPGHALLILSRASLCQPLAMDYFARVHGLTLAESAVLRALCNGTTPCEIASRTGVSVATVRTHIANLRQKTGAAAILDLVRMLTVLPPMRALFN